MDTVHYAAWFECRSFVSVCLHRLDRAAVVRLEGRVRGSERAIHSLDYRQPLGRFDEKLGQSAALMCLPI